MGYTNKSDTWNEGYRAAYIHYQPRDSNPHTHEFSSLREEWDKGWWTGFQDDGDIDDD